MTQQIDALQRGASRRGQACFTMPGRPIHPELSGLVAKDDPVIAEDHEPTRPPGLFGFLPEPGHRGFPGPGLTGEQITLSAAVHYPAGVHFDPAARRPQMDDQQFIQGVFAPSTGNVNVESSLVSAMVSSAILRSAERCNLPSSPEGAGESSAAGF